MYVYDKGAGYPVVWGLQSTRLPRTRTPRYGGGAQPSEILPAGATSANRFFLGHTAPPVGTPTPAFSPGWDLTTSAIRRLALEVRNDNSASSPSFAGTGVANTNRLGRQFITKALAVQTIAGTVKGQFRCNQSAAGDDYYPQCRIYVVSSAGSVVRGVLLEMHTDPLSNEFVTALTNRKFPKGGIATLTPVATQENDRLVIEVGWRQASGSTGNGRIHYANNSATDLPENETQTAVANSWMEFSQTLQFASAEPPLIGSSPVARMRNFTANLGF